MKINLKTNSLAIFRVTTAIVVLFLISGCDTNDPITYDMEALYKTPEQSSRDVSPAVQKHFPPGMKLEDALSLLKRHGFEILPINRKGIPEGQKWYSANKQYRRVRILLALRANVIVESDGAKVLKSRGYIFVDAI